MDVVDDLNTLAVTVVRRAVASDQAPDTASRDIARQSVPWTVVSTVEPQTIQPGTSGDSRNVTHGTNAVASRPLTRAHHRVIQRVARLLREGGASAHDSKVHLLHSPEDGDARARSSDVPPRYCWNEVLTTLTGWAEPRS